MTYRLSITQDNTYVSITQEIQILSQNPDLPLKPQLLPQVIHFIMTYIIEFIGTDYSDSDGSAYPPQASSVTVFSIIGEKTYFEQVIFFLS